jgi:hypothetical protein
MIGIIAAVVVASIIGPAMPQNDRVFVPVDRVALPAAELACECEIGNGCKCDNCRCEEPAIIQVVEKPQPPKVISVDPITGYAATKPAVVMISRSWCGPCQAFKRGSMPSQLRAQGWDFRFNETAQASSFPTYRVFDGSRWHTVKGVLNGTRLRMILNPRYSPAVPMRERVQSQGVSWTIAGNPWTRESLIDHLATNPNHGHSRAKLEAMSFGELDRLHTSDHQSTHTIATVRQSSPLVRRSGLFARRSCASCN